MGRKKKFVLAAFLIDILFCAVFIILLKNWIIPVAVNTLGFFCLAVLFVMNKILLKSNWYKNLFVDYNHERYPDNVWYRKHDERNFDLVNLGSNCSKYAFDYSDCDIKAMNWAPGSQTLIDDFKLIKNFHSILKDGGIVLITIMPFTSINKKVGFIDSFKYCDTLDSTLIDEKYRRKCYLLKNFPVLFGKSALKAFVKVLLEKDRDNNIQCKTETNPMTDNQLKEDAKHWIDNWKKEFSISDLSAPLTDENLEGRKFRIEVMRNLIDFCIERGYKPIYVIPPVTQYLDKYFSDSFKKIYIYNFLEEVARTIPLLDYSNDTTLMDKDLYFNSYFLNMSGAKVFTKKVLSEIKR